MNIAMVAHSMKCVERNSSSRVTKNPGYSDENLKLLMTTAIF
jgi:hypothetical protein